MKLIKDFDLSPLLRMAWVSREARDIWEGPLQDCSDMVQELEIESVAAGHRPCAWRTIPLKSIPEFGRKCAALGLGVLPVKLVGNWGTGFAHHTPPVKEGEDPDVYTIIYRNIQDAEVFLKAHENEDHITQGRMLGFPSCCRKFFDRVWKEGYFDPIWQIGQNSHAEEKGGKNIRYFSAHPYSNPILRYIGIRVGFHIPCSFNCQQTINIASRRLDLAKEKYKDLVPLLVSLLSMRMEWDVLHGIAKIRTPIFYVETSSVPTIENFRVRILGKFKPKEAARGNCFPFAKDGEK